MQLFEKWESDIRGYCRAYPTVFTSASNARQVDEAGKSYIDFFAGAGVLNFGHNHPNMKKAVIDFIENDGVAHSLDMYTTPKREFIKAFAETILEPRGMNHKMQFMGPTGSNAVEAALKLARKVTGRTEVVAFSQGFHGMTMGSLALTANSYYRDAAGVPLNHVTRAPFETTMGCGAGCVNTLRQAYTNVSSGYEMPAAFVVETIQAEGGVNIASKEWLLSIQQLAHDIGALFVIDDIQVGCGRTGPYFSFDGMGLEPDIVCLAKGLGGFGTPIAMNLVKPEHDAHWKPGEHTGTFRGQGISFVAGREGIRFFEDDELEQRTKARGARMMERLQQWSERFGNGEYKVRGKGMIFGLDLCDVPLSKAVSRECFDRGLLVGPCGVNGAVMKFIPPLTISDEDLDEGMDIFEQALSEKVG